MPIKNIGQPLENSYLLGQCTSADDAYLALRGLRTMAVRLKQHEQAAIEVAKWLETHHWLIIFAIPLLQRARVMSSLNEILMAVTAYFHL